MSTKSQIQITKLSNLSTEKRFCEILFSLSRKKFQKFTQPLKNVYILFVTTKFPTAANQMVLYRRRLNVVFHGQWIKSNEQ